MSAWITWGILLFLQQASHTASSRAKNSRSLWYSSMAGVFSHGVWFASNSFMVVKILDTRDNPTQFALTFLFYVSICVIGGVSAHWYLMRWEDRRGVRHG